MRTVSMSLCLCSTAGDNYGVNGLLFKHTVPSGFGAGKLTGSLSVAALRTLLLL